MTVVVMFRYYYYYYYYSCVFFFFVDFFFFLTNVWMDWVSFLSFAMYFISSWCIISIFSVQFCFFFFTTNSFFLIDSRYVANDVASCCTNRNLFSQLWSLPSLRPFSNLGGQTGTVPPPRRLGHDGSRLWRFRDPLPRRPYNPKWHHQNSKSVCNRLDNVVGIIVCIYACVYIWWKNKSNTTLLTKKRE